MAIAGVLVAMFANVSAHRYGFEFWGIRTADLVDSQAGLPHWAVTGRPAEGPARAPKRVKGRRRVPGPVRSSVAKWSPTVGADVRPHPREIVVAGPMRPG